MSDLIKRLRGKYSVGPDGVYEDGILEALRQQ